MLHSSCRKISKVDLDGKSAVFVSWFPHTMGATRSCFFIWVQCIQVTKDVEEKYSKKWCQGGDLSALELLALMKT